MVPRLYRRLSLPLFLPPFPAPSFGLRCDNPRLGPELATAKPGRRSAARGRSEVKRCHGWKGPIEFASC